MLEIISLLHSLWCALKIVTDFDCRLSILSFHHLYKCL